MWVWRSRIVCVLWSNRHSIGYISHLQTGKCGALSVHGSSQVFNPLICLLFCNLLIDKPFCRMGTPSFVASISSILVLLMFCECYTETTTLSNHIDSGKGIWHWNVIDKTKLIITRKVLLSSGQQFDALCSRFIYRYIGTWSSSLCDYRFFFRKADSHLNLQLKQGF